MSVLVLEHPRYVPPLASSFSTLVGTNSETPTQTDTSDRGLLFSFGSSPGGGNNVRRMMKAKTTLTSNYDIIARIQVSPVSFAFFTYGICISDGTKSITFGCARGPQVSTNTRLCNIWWTDATTYNTDRLDTHNFQADRVEWFRINVVAGVPTSYYVSADGSYWVKVLSEAATGWLTYTQVGFAMTVNRNGGLLPVASTPQAHMNVLYFSDPDIVPGV